MSTVDQAREVYREARLERDLALEDLAAAQNRLAKTELALTEAYRAFVQAAGQ